MPVTIYPSPEKTGKNTDPISVSNVKLLRATSNNWIPLDARTDAGGKPLVPESRPILQSSFSDIDEGDSKLIPYSNGLVNGLIRAFQQDLHVVLRPDDIWLSILTQFGMFVNGHAKELRSLFVEHEDKKELRVDTGAESIWAVGIGKLAQWMTHLISENVVDPELRDWIMPNFTTTTDNDKSVAAVVMMATMQPYFIYVLSGGCGFPSVKLMGEPSDWEEILRRVKKLGKYGAETEDWSKLLVPVISRFIVSFYNPQSPQIKDFWLRACHSAGQDGSDDTESVSGWLTAFCFWDKYGKRIKGLSKDYYYLRTSWSDRKPLTLDEIEYPVIRAKNIPMGTLSVPVTVQDIYSRKEHETTIVAGLVGMSLKSVDGSDTVQPRSGWWMLQDSIKNI